MGREQKGANKKNMVKLLMILAIIVAIAGIAFAATTILAPEEEETNTETGDITENISNVEEINEEILSEITGTISKVNPPLLGDGMKAVYWLNEDGTGETISDKYPAGSYYYVLGDGVNDTKESRWANAITKEDGSYWVWIPRYAYKITYYEDENKTTVKGVTTSTGEINGEKTLHGDIDILFMKGTSNDEYYDKNGNVVTGLPEGYKVHPAFQQMITTDDLKANPLGKWDKELTGIWVAKYEASREISEDNGTTWLNGGTSNTLTTNAGNTDSTLSRVVSKPSVISWRSISPSNSYQNSISMHTDLNSHEMKNSEWGAVAYLTHSSYGRNGNEVGVNQASDYYTGAGPTGTEDVYDEDGLYSFTSEYGWNTEQGKKASTTGNIYGIYDMAGGAYEFIAAYVDNEHEYITDETYGGALRNNNRYEDKTSICIRRKQWNK